MVCDSAWRWCASLFAVSRAVVVAHVHGHSARVPMSTPGQNFFVGTVAGCGITSNAGVFGGEKWSLAPLCASLSAVLLSSVYRYGCVRPGAVRA